MKVESYREDNIIKYMVYGLGRAPLILLVDLDKGETFEEELAKRS